MNPSLYWQVALMYTYALAWIIMSAGVIMFNKWVLSMWGFDFPITLTMWHMFFCSVFSFLLVRSGLVTAPDLSRQQIMQSILPIGALFSGTLWFGNAAYSTLSVSFIQMIKAFMPVAVYTAGMLWGVDKFDWRTVGTMSMVAIGISVASYGEVHFVLVGVLYQLASIATECNRIVLVQILMQSKGVKLNPITTMYYISPCCFACLLFPWTFVEAPRLLSTMFPRDDLGENPWLNGRGIMIFLASAAAAFGLNCCVYLLIGKTSALTMNVAGVVKDWLLIFLSWAVYGAPVSETSLLGYSLAFSAVCYYNYCKLESMKKEEARKMDPARVKKLEDAAAEGKSAVLDVGIVGEEMSELKSNAPISPSTGAAERTHPDVPK